MQANPMVSVFALIGGAGGALFILERLYPARPLPPVEKWWSRVVVVNILQAGVVVLGGFTWERWMLGSSVLHLTHTLGIPGSSLTAYLVITLVYYWWHRLRHDSPFLWRVLHQLHHSPQRIEIITSFYKHPAEIFANSMIISLLVYCFLGLTPAAAGYVTVLTCYAEFFYHMNLRTPRWVGYLIQRPESHRIHHELGKHYRNFADLPLWDMLFGTFYNPRDEVVVCGFEPEREARFEEMLRFHDVHSRRGDP
jgi:sterol desaturase/sphingolipid hydroxylase (fatty acid hydroxylase superfamily)